MPAKLVKFPSKGGGVPPKEQHVIRQRLEVMGKDIKWLAKGLRVTPQCLYSFMSGKTELKRIHFYRMLKLLEINENYYFGVGQYAEQCRTEAINRRLGKQLTAKQIIPQVENHARTKRTDN